MKVRSRSSVVVKPNFGCSSEGDALPVIFLLGPTASGKTEIAILLSQRLDCRLISVDSSLVYRGLDIGTAKPSPEELAIAPHSLIDICNPWDSYSAARFCTDAATEIRQARQASQIPVLVGGTMLYFNALEHGLATMPAADPAIRLTIAQRAEKSGWDSIHRELETVDPVAAAKIHPNDPQRIQRALEVWEISGKRISQWQAEGIAATNVSPILKIGLYPDDRAELHRRIERRFQRMIKSGFLDEVKKLLADERIDPSLPSMKAVGYRQAIEYLTGKSDSAEFELKSMAATRQLAKRQLTWMRAMSELKLIDSTVLSAQSVTERIACALTGPEWKNCD